MVEANSDPSEIGALLTTGTMAERTASTPRTVRFYEEEGLINPCQRTGGGHRLFQERELTRLQFVLDLREAGLSLGAIKKLFLLKGTCSKPREASIEMRKFLNGELIQLQCKIEKLQGLAGELQKMCESLNICETCEEPDFPKSCVKCEKVCSKTEPRSLRVLWRNVFRLKLKDSE